VLRFVRPAAGPRNRGSAIVAPGTITSSLTMTRAQPSGAVSTSLSSDGITWTTYTADTPRYNDTGRFLLLSGTRTNGVRNPRGEGVAAGSPGTSPTNWTMPASGGGLTRQIVSTVTANGIPMIGARFTGTASSTTTLVIICETATGIAITPGQTCTSSVFVSLTIASGATPALYLSNREFDSGGAVPVADNTNPPQLTPTTTPQRFSRTTVMGGTSAYLAPSIRINVTNGSVYDFTVYTGWPQVEVGSAFASTPILPAVSSPAAATRGSEYASALLADLGLTANCTVLFAGSLRATAASGVNQNIVQIDDGSDTNRFRMYQKGGAATIVCSRTLGGDTSDSSSMGNMVADTTFRAGISMATTGRVAASLNGGTVVAATGGPTTGMTTLRLGNNQSLTSPMFGDVSIVRVINRTLSDAELQAAVSVLS
jgi:hypothetical protein